MNVGDKVKHCFEPRYGSGTISLVRPHGCMVTWETGTSFEPFENLELITEE